MPWWKDYPWRMIQTNLSEIDMADISAKRYVEDIKYFNANVVLLNAAGIIASYETDIDFHYQSPYLQGDSLKDIVDLCHENDIKVIARTDFSKVHKSIYERRPEWAFRTAEGEIMNYNDCVQCCINGDYQQKYAYEIIAEMFRKIPFDGLFCNMGGFQTKDYDLKDYGFCHCESCRRKFREMYGHELPENQDMENPVYGMYREFQMLVFKKHRENVAKFVKSINKNLCFDDEAYARIESGTKLKAPGHRQYHASSNCRVILGDGASGIICSNTSVDFISYELRHVAVTPQRQKLRLWQNLVNLGGLDYFIMGRPDKRPDKSGYKSVKEVFAFHKAHEKEYVGMKSKAKVLLKRTHRWEITPEEHGWMRTLTESHISFAEILPTKFMDADLSKYRLLILPDIKYMSDNEIGKIDEFAKSGGMVVATGKTGLYDHKSGMRKSQALECMGIKEINYTRRDMKSSMMFIQEAEKAIFSSYKDVSVIPVGDSFVYTVPKEGAETYLKLILPHRFGPPEKCYFTEISDIPGMIRYAYGKGFGVWAPWMPGAFYTDEGHSNTFWFMKDIIINMCGIKPLADSSLTPMAEVSLSGKNDGTLLVQMVNNSGSFGISYFDPLPIYGCRLQIPSDTPPVIIKSIVSGEALDYEYKDKTIFFTVKKLDEYEAIKITY